MDSSRRQHYRVELEDSGGLRLRIANPGGEPFDCRLLDLSASGAGARFDGDNPPDLAVGQEIDLAFSSEELDPPLVVAARVQHRCEEDEGRRYGFRFLQQQRLDRRVPPAVRHYFNRRRAERVPTDPAEVTTATLEVFSLESPVEVRVHDLSPLGARISLEAGFDRLFASVVAVRMTLNLPDQKRPFILAAHIRYRQLIGDRIYYGMEFAAEGAADADRHLEAIRKWARRRAQQLKKRKPAA